MYYYGHPISYCYCVVTVQRVMRSYYADVASIQELVCAPIAMQIGFVSHCLSLPPAISCRRRWAYSNLVIAASARRRNRQSSRCPGHRRRQRRAVPAFHHHMARLWRRYDWRVSIPDHWPEPQSGDFQKDSRCVNLNDDRDYCMQAVRLKQ